mmetsp:Transcript_6862/g.8963  ORF Transcript_6862/g.8963 Transcript_6862/m.8963 type:complete len:367 (-) Transcript_6862:1841-2941(-)
MWFLSSSSSNLEKDTGHTLCSNFQVRVEEYSCLVWTSKPSSCNQFQDESENENVLVSANVNIGNLIDVNCKSIVVLVPIEIETKTSITINILSERLTHAILEKCGWCFPTTVKLSILAKEEGDAYENTCIQTQAREYMKKQRCERLKRKVVEANESSVLAFDEVIKRFQMKEKLDINSLHKNQYGSKGSFLAFVYDINETNERRIQISFSYSYSLPDRRKMKTVVVPVSTPFLGTRTASGSVMDSDLEADEFYKEFGPLHPVSANMNHNIYSIGMKRSSGITGGGKTPLEYTRTMQSKKSISAGTHVQAVKPEIVDISSMFTNTNVLFKDMLENIRTKKHYDLRLRRIVGSFNTALDIELLQECST